MRSAEESAVGDGEATHLRDIPMPEITVFLCFTVIYPRVRNQKASFCSMFHGDIPKSSKSKGLNLKRPTRSTESCVEMHPHQSHKCTQQISHTNSHHHMKLCASFCATTTRPFVRGSRAWGKTTLNAASTYDIIVSDERVLQLHGLDVPHVNGGVFRPTV